MNKILNSVDGSKTYITAGIAAIVVFLQMAEILPIEQTIALLGLLGAGSVASIRHAIEKLEAFK
jgi:hypothetical protein